jgi:2-keto-4-pentenoate hydratase/2-oxohepta-3-ene-1,7-dioic acid hydratase in catechol pathway
MKLVRYGAAGREKPGLIDADGALRSLAAIVPDITGDVLAPARLRKLQRLDPRTLPKVRGAPRLGPPVANVGKLIGIGFNYADHAARAGMAIPTEPLIFMKAVSAIGGPHDPILIPPGAEKTDWEVELAFVIGAQATRVPERLALSHIAGYLICNDVTERSYQFDRGGTYDKGKGCDSFAPLGPWLVTADEVPDPQGLDLWLERNGERMQSSTTAHMVFGVAFILSYVSRFMTLLPGDIVTTGTPLGTGFSRKPPIFLKAGDNLCLGITGLGRQSQTCMPAVDHEHRNQTRRDNRTPPLRPRRRKPARLSAG